MAAALPAQGHDLDPDDQAFFDALLVCAEDRLFVQQSHWPWGTSEHGFAQVIDIKARARNPLVYVNGELLGQLNNYSENLGYYPEDLACGSAPPAWLQEHNLEYEYAWLLRMTDVYDSRESVGWIWIETATFIGDFES
jgi:hypothetical protein